MRRVLTTLALGGALCAAGSAATAQAGTARGCAPSARAQFARVQLYEDANCRGASVIVRATEGGNRPDFARFENFDGTVRSVDGTRSSLAIDRGTCVRLFDGKAYGGPASTNICASDRPVFWNLERFDDRASSMRVCPVARQADCNAPAAPAPAPTQPAFDPDPRGFGGATAAEKKRRFYPKMLPLARAVRAEFGIPVSFALAQAANESAYGTATFVVARNFYGIKCVNGSVGPARIASGCTNGRTTEVFDGRRKKLTAQFRTYRTVLDSMRDMGSLLKRKYPRAMAVARDPNAFARAVQAGGYATDPDYARTIVSIMRVNGLYAYDE